MATTFERLCASLSDDARVALLQIAENPENAALVQPMVVLPLLAKGLVNYIDGTASLSERGRRVIDHFDAELRKALRARYGGQ